MLIDCSKDPTTATTDTESTLGSVQGGEQTGMSSAKGGRGGEKGGKKNKDEPEPEPPGVWSLYDGLNGVYSAGCIGGYTAVSADFFMKLGWSSESDY